MNFNFLTLFKQKTKQALEEPLVIKNIKSLEKDNEIYVFNDIKIYHHTKSYNIPLLIFDKDRGLYIFEKKDWLFNDLENSSIKKVENNQQDENNLAYSYIHKIINKKFNELTHKDSISIHNYIILNNITKDEFKNINKNVKQYIPENKTIFKDSQSNEISQKLKNIKKIDSISNVNDILGNLLIQYTIVEDENNLKFCTKEQINFLNQPLKDFNNLLAEPKSGKTNLILLKAIIEVLENNKKVVIIKPTTLSKDILQQKFLEIIEHAIIDIDLSSIEILTPVEIINKHLQKLKSMPINEDNFYIDRKLMKKKFNLADIVICDDTPILPDNFLFYIKHIQNKKSILFVNNKNEIPTYQLKQSFFKEKEIIFYKTNPYAKALHIINKLIKDYLPQDIMVISDKKNRAYLEEDLKGFIESTTRYVDGQNNLINQNLDKLLLSTFKDIVDIKAKCTIIIYSKSIKKDMVEIALNNGLEKTYILYESDFKDIQYLKEKYENN